MVCYFFSDCIFEGYNIPKGQCVPLPDITDRQTPFAHNLKVRSSFSAKRKELLGG